MKKVLFFVFMFFSIEGRSSAVVPFVELATKIASIVDQKEKTKYTDKILEIKKELHDEELKTIPDDGRISYLHSELMRIYSVLGNTISAEKN